MVVIVTIARLSPCTKIHHHHHHHHHHHDDDHRHRRHHDSILETSISVIITISRHLSSTRRMAHRVLGSEPPAVVGSRFLDPSARRSGEMCARQASPPNRNCRSHTREGHRGSSFQAGSDCSWHQMKESASCAGASQCKTGWLMSDFDIQICLCLPLASSSTRNL